MITLPSNGSGKKRWSIQQNIVQNASNGIFMILYTWLATSAHAPNRLQIINYRVTGAQQICQRSLLSTSEIMLFFCFMVFHVVLMSCWLFCTSLGGFEVLRGWHLFTAVCLEAPEACHEADSISTARCCWVTGLVFAWGHTCWVPRYWYIWRLFVTGEGDDTRCDYLSMLWPHLWLDFWRECRWLVSAVILFDCIQQYKVSPLGTGMVTAVFPHSHVRLFRDYVHLLTPFPLGGSIPYFRDVQLGEKNPDWWMNLSYIWQTC